MKVDRLITTAEALLRAEKAALLSGDVAKLEKLAARKARILPELGAARLSVVQLHLISRLSAENATLIEAMMQAIRDTRSLLESARAKPDVFSYNATGQRESLASASATLAHRA